jgi:hypothetical protein
VELVDLSNTGDTRWDCVYAFIRLLVSMLTQRCLEVASGGGFVVV